jgi:LytS/YehU family sensor histidine kinase
MYLLVPKFLLRNRYYGYGFGIVAYLGLAYLLVSHVKPYLEADRKDQILVPTIFWIVVLVAASTAIKLFQRWIRDSERINELEKTTIQAELEQLKNQINPHFLFNMLNNANLLTQKDPVKASQVLMKLSDLLRYQLYDSTRPKVLVTADIQFLTDFLNLEKIRRDNFDFQINQEGEINGVQVAPLLFINFVENAIKHNVDAERLSFVDLNFKVKGDELYFKCINSKPPVKVKSNPGGLGLANLKRRLELLYPGQHDLYVRDEAHLFCVALMIKL